MGFVLDDGVVEAKVGPTIMKYSLNISQIDFLLSFRNYDCSQSKEKLCCYHIYLWQILSFSRYLLTYLSIKLAFDKIFTSKIYTDHDKLFYGVYKITSVRVRVWMIYQIKMTTIIRYIKVVHFNYILACNQF